MRKERSRPENTAPVCSGEKELVQKTSLGVESPKYFCGNTGFGRVLGGGVVGFPHRLPMCCCANPRSWYIFTDQWKREQESVGIAE